MICERASYLSKVHAHVFAKTRLLRMPTFPQKPGIVEHNGNIDRMNAEKRGEGQGSRLSLHSTHRLHSRDGQYFPGAPAFLRLERQLGEGFTTGL